MKSFSVIVVLAASCAVSFAAPSPTPPAATSRPAASRPTTAPQAGTGKKLKPEAAAADFLDNGPLPTLHVQVDPKQLKALNDRPREPVRALVREVIAGQPDRIYCDVGLHLKGGAGSFRKTDDRPALTLNFDKFVDGQDFHGLDKVHLNNSVQDGTYMVENLGGWVFRQAGCPAPRVSNARVYLNGRDLGAFVVKQGFDGVLFKTFFGDKTGMLYEGSYGDIDRELPLHPGVNPPEPVNLKDKKERAAIDAAMAAQRKAAHAKMKELVDASRDPDLSKRKERLAKVLDVDEFITFIACESIVAFWDGYGPARNNFRIYDNPKTGKLVFMPQGMDGLLEQPGFPLLTSQGAIVSQALLATPEDKQRFYDKVAEIRQKVFTPERMTAELDRVSGRLAPMMAEISPGMAQQHKSATASLRQRILERITNIDRQLLIGPPKPIKFENGIAQLAKLNWAPTLTKGDALVDKVGVSGKTTFRVTVKEGAGNASWRLPLLLEKGRYVFEGRMETSGVVPATGGATATGGAGIRISGDKAPFRLKGDAAWQDVKYEFEITEPTKEVLLVCDLNAKAGTAWFDVASLKLRKK